MGLLLDGMGALLMKVAGKTDLLNAFFASVIAAKASSHESQTLETQIEK